MSVKGSSPRTARTTRGPRGHVGSCWKWIDTNSTEAKRARRVFRSLRSAPCRSRARWLDYRPDLLGLNAFVSALATLLSDLVPRARRRPGGRAPASGRQDSSFHLVRPAKTCHAFARTDRTRKRVGRATTLKCPRLGSIADDAWGNRHLHCRQVHCLGSLMVTLGLFSASQSFQHPRPLAQVDNDNWSQSDSTEVDATR